MFASCAVCPLGVVFNSVPWGLASGRVARGEGGRAFRVAGVGSGATGGLAEHRFAWQAQGAAADIARFRGPVREIGCAGARLRVRR